MKWIANITGGYSSSAKVVDGTLVLSLPDALTPVIWRMDLGHVKSSALEVRSRNDGTFVLTLKTPKGDVNDIAPFDSKAKAMKALMAVSAAMEHAHGHIRPAGGAVANDDSAASGAPIYAPAKKGGGAMAGIIGVIILVALIGVLFSMGPRNSSGLSADLDASGLSPAAGASAPAGAPGVPVSADDFLMNR